MEVFEYIGLFVVGVVLGIGIVQIISKLNG